MHLGGLKSSYQMQDPNANQIKVSLNTEGIKTSAKEGPKLISCYY